MNIKLHKGSLKLAGLYLAIIMTISIFFSVNIYQLSTDELNRGIRGAGALQKRPTGPGFSVDIRDEILNENIERYEAAKQRVLNRLLITNLIILVGGGLLSYYLALRTLRPIEEAHESQNRFTADASHELRTPITALVTENEVALMDPGLNLKDAKLQLESNVEELQKISNLTDGLLRLSGLDNRELLKEEFDLVSAANLAIERAGNNAKPKNISIVKKMPKNLNLTGDPDGLQEVIYILLDNAIKYSPDKSKVEINLSKTKSGAEIEVKDNGVGIKATELPHIFDRFYRADSSRTKQQTSGYGLGLAIAKDIVEKHSGTINVKSTVGKGATFTVVL